LPAEEYLERFRELVGIIARLRAPDGCPWDRRQTHASLREGLLEECYEVLEAIDGNAADKLREELGDLMLHIIFQAQIAAEAGEFDLAAVLGDINRKLIRRHPHVFGDGSAADAAAVARGWEHLKQAERDDGDGALDSVPQTLPALAYSQSVQGRVARLGFDWKEDGGVLEKLAEEIAEFHGAGDHAAREEEFGDIIFTLVKANRKFKRRFKCMEALCRERKLDFGELSAEAQNELWEEAKREA